MCTYLFLFIFQKHSFCGLRLYLYNIFRLLLVAPTLYATNMFFNMPFFPSVMALRGLWVAIGNYLSFRSQLLPVVTNGKINEFVHISDRASGKYRVKWYYYFFTNVIKWIGTIFIFMLNFN